MIDNAEAGMWAEHGHHFSEQVARAFSKAWVAFERLHDIQFDAPWKRETRRTGRQARRA